MKCRTSQRFFTAAVWMGLAVLGPSPAVGQSAWQQLLKAAPLGQVSLPDIPEAAPASVGLPGSGAAPGQGLFSQLGDELHAIYRKAVPSVVTIRVSQPSGDLVVVKDFYGRERLGRLPPRMGQGSGFVIHPEGYIMTNSHVVAGAGLQGEVLVEFANGTKLAGRVLAADPKTEVALVKVQARESLPALKLGSAASLKIGHFVFALGSPMGFEQSFTFGTVNGLNRRLGDFPTPLIQLDASINPGSSGGPLLNAQGEVVGINTMIATPNGKGFAGIGLAVPIDAAGGLLSRLAER